jgi:hypothetical protein
VICQSRKRAAVDFDMHIKYAEWQLDEDSPKYIVVGIESVEHVHGLVNGRLVQVRAGKTRA